VESIPLVSVVLPFRNAAPTLEECLGSIARQNFGDYEVVAVDDRSEDASRKIVEEAAERDSRIRIVSSEDKGLVGALNTGLEASRGEFIARMDADDVMLPSRLRQQSGALRSDPRLDLVACMVESFPGESVQVGLQEYLRWQNGCVSPGEIRDNLFVEAPFVHPSVMYRRQVVLKSGGYRDGDFPEDYELWLRLAEQGAVMTKLPEVLLRWRDRPDRLTRTDPRYSRDAFDRIRAEYLARDSRLNGGRELFFWGAGRRTRVRARHLIAAGLIPSSWVDIDPRKIGRSIEAVPVLPPSSLDRQPRPFVLVLVTSHGARELIASDLSALGYEIGRDYLPVGI
jgi:glycosyltransferase involved in cell wall biosynthesis